MKKFILLPVLMFSLALSASDICIDGIYYLFENDEAIVTYKGSIHYEDMEHYQGTVTIPESVEYNGKTYPVTQIGEGAFWCCQKLTHLVIPNSVKVIGLSACYFTSLEKVIIPDGVDSIAMYAFGAQFFKELHIGKGLRKFAMSAFSEDDALRKIEVSPCNPYFTSGDNCNAIINRQTKELVLGCQNTYIPTYVTAISPDAFNWCTQLTSITIPHNVVSIGDGAFNACGSLEKVVLGRSVKTIGSMAFDQCLNLVDVTCYATQPPFFVDEDYGLGFEEEVWPQVIYVPKGTKGTYMTTTGWKNYDCYSEIDVPADPKEDVMPPVECGEETGIDFIPAYNKYENKMHKVIRNGNLYVLHNGNTYTITGAQIH